MRYKRKRKTRNKITPNKPLLSQTLLKKFNNLKASVVKEGKCSRCGACCNTFKVRITQEDIDTEPQLIENHIPLSEDILKIHEETDVLKYVGMLKTISESDRRCVFYDEKEGCKIYTTRPAECIAYVPSLAHCRDTRTRKYWNLEIYFNEHQKECVLFCKVLYPTLTEEDRIQRLRMLINSFIFPFISECNNGGFSEPNYDFPIPLFIKKSLKLNNSYRIIGDLPMIKDFYKSYKDYGRI